MITFDQAKQHADDLESRHAERNSMFEDIEDMYLLEPPSLPSESWIKQTVSPSARNALLGAVRLMTATDPTWRVPASMEVDAQQEASRLETIANAIWTGAGRAARKPLHVDLVLSALMYGEVHLGINRVSDLIASANDENRERLQELASITPVLIDVINPRLGYPEFDRAGLYAYYSSREVRSGDVISRFGDLAAMQLRDRQPWDTVTECEYWDHKVHYLWVKEAQNPLIEAEHGLPCIPIVASIVEGSNLFNRSGQQSRQPFLYTLWKSGLWERETLTLTVMYSLIFSIGANPQFIYRRSDPSKAAPEADYSTPGGRIILDSGEDYAPLVKQILDPSLMQGLQLAQEQGTESTMFKQALGEPMSSGTAFSTVSLLSQAGRLPLVPYQRMGSFVIGEAMRTVFKLLKAGGGKSKAWGGNGVTEFKPSDLPDNPNIEARLEIEMPQDERQNAMIALQMTQGDAPLMSRARAREEYLGIGQPDEEEKAIWDEQASIMQFQMMLQQQAQQAQRQAQQQAQMAAIPPQGMGQMPTGGPGAQPGLEQTGAEPGLPGVAAGAPLTPRNEPPMPEGGLM